MPSKYTASFGIPVKSLDALAGTTPTTGESFAMPGGRAIALTFQSIFSAAPAVVSLVIEASNDDSNFNSIGTTTLTAGDIQTVYTSAKFIRARLISKTGGGTTTVIFTTASFDVTVVAPGANPFDQDLNTTDDVEFESLKIASNGITDIPASMLQIGLTNPYEAQWAFSKTITQFQDDYYGLGGYFEVVFNPAIDNTYLTEIFHDVSTSASLTRPIEGIIANDNYVFHKGSGAANYIVGQSIALGGTSGAIDEAGAYVAILQTSAPIISAYGFQVNSPQIGAPGSINASVAFYAQAQGHALVSNAYSFWQNDRGVFRIKADNTFGATYQGIAALYNYTFTKYVPGAADYERGIFGQWNADVYEIGTEKGGTGILRPVKFLGSGFTFTTPVTISATNLITDTTTGMKIGTATNQKLGFFNATPIVQGASVADAAGGVVIDAEARVALNALISRIEATGLIATV